ncbi:MAG TPA: RNA-directed DNA polymerase [Ruminiclostridium sp.]|nr:RNA-directed DNA polymerase [Ruminiclostridium sp.]
MFSELLPTCGDCSDQADDDLIVTGRVTGTDETATVRLTEYGFELYGGGWIVKLDVKKFFYSIDRDILKQLLRKRIKDNRFLRLLNLIIDSSPEGDTGIPLGNVTSQDMANIYLNELDQFCVRYLHIKYYTRYMDDVVFIVPTRDMARDYLKRCTEFLRERLHLEINQKTKVFRLRQVVNAFGFKIWTTHRLLRNKSKQEMKRRIRAMDAKLKAGTIRQKGYSGRQFVARSRAMVKQL